MTTTEERIQMLRLGLSQAQAKRTRAEVERDNLKAKVGEALDTLKTTLGTDNFAEATKKLETLEQEIQMSLTKIEDELLASGA